MAAHPLQPFSQSSTFQVKQRIKKAQFGDGYSQRVGDGLNNKYVEGVLVNENITQTQLNTLMSFWETNGLITSFDITLPYNSQTIKVVFTSGPSITASAGGIYTVSQEVMQDFNL